MFLVVLVCLSVCLSVCEKITPNTGFQIASLVNVFKYHVITYLQFYTLLKTDHGSISIMIPDCQFHLMWVCNDLDLHYIWW